MHHFHAGDRTPGRPKRFETEHGTRQPFHGSMVLLYNIIEILALPDHDGRLVNLVVVRNRRRVAATLIDGNFLRQSLVAPRSNGSRPWSGPDEE